MSQIDITMSFLQQCYFFYHKLALPQKEGQHFLIDLNHITQSLLICNSQNF